MATKDEQTNLEKIQNEVTNVGKSIVKTNRTLFRTYLDAAFRLQRAGLDALGLFQNEMEKQTVKLVDRSEKVQDRVAEDVQSRLNDGIAQLQESREKGIETLNANVERLREARDKGVEALSENREKVNELFDTSISSLREVINRLQSNAGDLQGRLRLSRDEMDEATDLTESRVREAAEIAIKVARVLEHRIESVIGELVELGRREWSEIEQRVDSLVDRLDAELDDEITPIANYDDKTVEEVLTGIEGLDNVQLRAVRSHETSHKNRITVLRAIDERLAVSGPSIVERVEKRVTQAVDQAEKNVNQAVDQAEKSVTKAVDQAEKSVTKAADQAKKSVSDTANNLVLAVKGYDNKNAEEVIAALKNLTSIEELSELRAYEVSNKNRVTVLRAIDEKVAELTINA